ncbi:hypothetical protein M407DRAFT_29373 [Tulasnella calospora MUT 4182]|uniref:Uncharacterized protein n=1 Tax=Tulasnella calospora MUT 4182 TaxID=1051891 RepID=A0A0C3PZK4_9AGAM|nr:hypothetical protein M407DRAFT_29373 [Tulasnella calospora MUT 4182]
MSSIENRICKAQLLKGLFSSSGPSHSRQKTYYPSYNIKAKSLQAVNQDHILLERQNLVDQAIFQFHVEEAIDSMRST